MAQPGGGMPDMQQILQQAQQMQQQMMEAQQEIAQAEVTGTAGGGMVTATVSGELELKKLDIDPKIVDPEDVETLSDLVVAAVRDATSNAQQLQQEKLGPIAGGLGGGEGLPGMGNLGLPGM
ncbi:YbaB/EbfC family nucleoid-associated protein [Saccharomonospora sp. CUA-673]|uniref:YbaB/EbfC family nucleoid-associated protein n=1 Tax=Saccharomonospora sp. CUA-673 TaxID=1904969 RepID=UPI000961F7AA|nr:YbaB/EbfC family nucleoid-associated protein [Saccharomonospora sp. CUA-673]OLT45387.1 YbaB/EbfC family nucleoid-associated protein [Saccharomonospora sp. CUA-673]